MPMTSIGESLWRKSPRLSSGCQRGFAVNGTFPLGIASVLDIELTLFLFVFSPFSPSLFSLLPLQVFTCFLLTTRIQ